MKKQSQKIVIIGSGAFGTAIANMVVDLNDEVIIYGHDKLEIDDINLNHQNKRYFDEKIDAKIQATLNIKSALEGAQIIFFAIPSQVFKDVLIKTIVPNLSSKAYFVTGIKGFLHDDKTLISDFIEENIPSELNLGVLKLSGPSFAKEILNGTPTMFNLACKDLKIAEKLQKNFEAKFIKIFPTDKIREVEVNSIYKNAVSIFSGIIMGLNFGTNSLMLMLSYAAKELKEIYQFLNLDQNLIVSPSGIWELFINSFTNLSRNFAFGFKIGQENPEYYQLKEIFITTEGIQTIKILYKVNQAVELNLEIINHLYKIIYQGQQPSKIVNLFFDKIIHN